MPQEAPTTSELRRVGVIADAEITRAGDLFERGLGGVYLFESGHRLDLAAAVAAYAPARSTLADPTASANTRRAIVANAIMLARPKAP